MNRAERRVDLRDVTLRDGLQDEPPTPTATKLAILEGLVAAGITQLELCSFVRPDRVPAQADADDLAHRTHDCPARRWALVLNRRGADRAVAAGMLHLQFVLSVSERHNRENAGRTVNESLDALASVIETTESSGGEVEVTLATAFGCPYEGSVAPEQVLRVAERCFAAGASAISLADTIGTAVPDEVAQLTDAIVELAAGRPTGLHLHDTRGLAIANALVGIDHGIGRIDGSVGGLGGCPFAPGASGNLPLEDIVHVLGESGVETGIDLHALLDVARFACAAVGRSVGSHVGVAGPRFTVGPSS